MKLAIIQFSDLHIKSAGTYSDDFATRIAFACKEITNTCDKVAVVITGDIVDKGNINNYSIAENFLTKLKEQISRENETIKSFDYVIVPGNHDLDFSKPYKLRDRIVSPIAEDDFDDSQTLETLLEPQNEFWKFAEKLMGGVSYKVSYSKTINLDNDMSVIFHAYNTALLTTIEEKPQSLYIPKSAFIIRGNDANKHEIVISLFHHHPAWLNMSLNNRVQFEGHLGKNSDIVMCGHEHHTEMKSSKDLLTNDSTLYIECGPLTENNRGEFFIYTIDDEDPCSILYNKCEIVHSLSKITPNDPIHYQLQSKKSGLFITDDYNLKLDSIEIPITYPNKRVPTLKEMYVFPDLEVIQELDETTISKYADASTIIGEKSKRNIVLIEGDNQIGKSCLLKRYFYSLYNHGVFPILIDGGKKNKNGKNDIAISCRTSFDEQYDTKDTDYNTFKQLPREKKVLLIDNFDLEQYDKTKVTKILEDVLKQFDYIIATSSPTIKVNTLLSLRLENGKILIYNIKPLGHVKRDILVRNWIRYGLPDGKRQNDLAAVANKLFTKLSELLGNKFLPAYPVYILSLLNELNPYLENFDIQNTRFANMYQGLIQSALRNAGEPQGNWDGDIQFMSYLAFNMFKIKTPYISFDNQSDGSVHLEGVYNEYKKLYPVKHKHCSEVQDILINSRLLNQLSDDEYTFSWKYIYYYLVARFIYKNQEDEELYKSSVEELCRNLPQEDCANVLIFLAHESKGKVLLTELEKATRLPFAKEQCASLLPADELFKEMSNLHKVLKEVVIDKSNDPEKNRERQLEETDKLERTLQKKEKQESAGLIDFAQDTEVVNDPILKDFLTMLRTSEIIGQIIKSQTYDTKFDVIEGLITLVFEENMRSISCFNTIIKSSKDDILRKLQEDKKRTSNNEEISDNVMTLLQLLLLTYCLQIVSTIVNNIGTSELKESYNNVAHCLGTPLADYIAFAINLNHSGYKESELKAILKKYENNPVVLRFVRFSICQYVYNNKLGIDKIQQIGSLCKIRIVDNAAMMLKPKEK